MNCIKPCVLIIGAVLLTGCGEKAPEIPPPEPTAALFEASASQLILQQATALVLAA